MKPVASARSAISGSRRVDSTKLHVAIVGAGVAGLSAAHGLVRQCRITILEREKRVGGRVLTSISPRGEHGAEFVYRHDAALRRFIRFVGLRRALRPVDAWAWFYFDGRYATGSFGQIAKQLLPKASARRIVRLLERARLAGSIGQYPPDEGRTPWLLKYLRKDRVATRFVDMILSSETCAPLGHVRAKEVLGALYSESCYRIAGGTGRFVSRLRRQLRRSRVRFVTGARVNHLIQTPHHVVLAWRSRGRRVSRKFDGAVITTPDGTPYNRRRLNSHYHVYISVLLEFRRAWWSRHLADAMACGLYTDGPVNYVEEVHNGHGRPVLRVLLPNAERMLDWPDGKIVALCLENLRKLSPLCPRRARASVKKWRYGLPCRSLNPGLAANERVVLAGDRFGEWPSMNAAAESGQRAAKHIITHLTMANVFRNGGAQRIRKNARQK